MGRLVGIVLVLAVFVPFFAAADLVDGARRHAMATVMAPAQSDPVSHTVCRPAATDDCDDQAD